MNESLFPKSASEQCEQCEQCEASEGVSGAGERTNGPVLLDQFHSHCTQCAAPKAYLV